MSAMRHGLLSSFVAGVALLASSPSRADDVSPPPSTTPPPSTMAPTAPGETITVPTDAPFMTPTTTTAATTTTTAARYPGAPPGAEEEEERFLLPNRPLFIAGGASFLAGYIPAAIISGTSDNDDDDELWIPFVGPWIDVAQRDCGAECTSQDTWNMIGLIGSGLAQAGGLALVTASLFVPERTGSRMLGDAGPAHASAKPEVVVTPMSFRYGAGVGAVGTF